MQKRLIAKPKKSRILLINGGRHGSISLHPKQKWNVIYNSVVNKVYIERDCFTVILDKAMFQECFYMTRPE